MIDLMAIAAVDRETEVTYIRRERDWATRAAAEGRLVDPTPDAADAAADRRRRPPTTGTDTRTATAMATAAERPSYRRTTSRPTT